MAGSLTNSTFMNGVLITDATFNGTKLDAIYFNGVLVFTKLLKITISAGYHNEGAHINLKKLIEKYRKHNEHEILLTINHGSEVPTIVTGGMLSIPGVSKVTLKNEGIISAVSESGSALKLSETLFIDNSGGVIRGGGGHGGAGGRGGTGHRGADMTKNIPRSKKVVEKHGYTYFETWGYAEGLGQCSSNKCDYVAWDGKYHMFCSGKTSHIPGLSGVFSRGKFVETDPAGGCPWNHYEIVRTYTKKWTEHKKYTGGRGGDGGAGGIGGAGSHYKNGKTKGGGGHGGSNGGLSSPHGGHSGYKGGTGGAGGSGGDWGRGGGTGANGGQGQGHGSLGANGAHGGRAGYSIEGYRFAKIVIKGTLTGPTHN